MPSVCLQRRVWNSLVDGGTSSFCEQWVIGGQHTSERRRVGAQKGLTRAGSHHHCRRTTGAARGITGSTALLVLPAGQQLLNQANALGHSPKRTAQPEYKSTCISTWKDSSKPLSSQLLAGGQMFLKIQAPVLWPPGLSTRAAIFKAPGTKSHQWIPNRKRSQKTSHSPHSPHAGDSQLLGVPSPQPLVRIQTCCPSPSQPESQLSGWPSLLVLPTPDGPVSLPSWPLGAERSQEQAPDLSLGLAFPAPTPLVLQFCESFLPPATPPSHLPPVCSAEYNVTWCSLRPWTWHSSSINFYCISRWSPLQERCASLRWGKDPWPISVTLPPSTTPHTYAVQSGSSPTMTSGWGRTNRQVGPPAPCAYS